MRDAPSDLVEVVFEDTRGSAYIGDAPISWRAGYLVGLLCLSADWDDAAEAAGFTCSWRPSMDGGMVIEAGGRRVDIDIFAFAANPHGEARRLGELLEPPEWRCA